MSYRLFRVGFILEGNLLTTKDTKEHEGFKTFSFVTLCDTHLHCTERSAVQVSW
jgi:hypothetical protein